MARRIRLDCFTPLYKNRWEEMVRGSTVNGRLRLCRTVDILIVANE